MLRYCLNVAMIFLGLGVGPAAARDLLVEIAVLHIRGVQPPEEFDAMLADERLSVEAGYVPTRLIEGVTARRERIMPIGSRLFAIYHDLNISSARIERQGRVLRFSVPNVHPEHSNYYRLGTLKLRLPSPPGQAGRPQSDTGVSLMHEPPKAGAYEAASLLHLHGYDLGVRLRYRWSDARDATLTVDPTVCRSYIQALGNGEYRFRERHRASGLFSALASTVQSDPPSRPPAGQRSLRMHEPYPESVAGWRLSRNHMVQLQAHGQTVERFSVYAQQEGSGRCRHTRGYEALFADGKLVELRRNYSDFFCRPEDAPQGSHVEAGWLEDGSLDRYHASAGGKQRSWDAFTAAESPRCGGDTAPPEAEVRALVAEFQQLREAFLRP